MEEYTEDMMTINEDCYGQLLLKSTHFSIVYYGSKRQMKEANQTETQRTIIIAQPTRKVQPQSLEGDLTDEYLNSVLPMVGFKIIPPPSNYDPQHRAPRLSQSEGQSTPKLPEEFSSLYTDLRQDEELTPTEQKARFVMKLLIQIKEGSVYQRKMALRLLTNHAPDMGAELIFSKLLPLLQSNILNVQERHSFVKTIDRLMYRLSSSISQYSPNLFAFIGKMLTERDSLVRSESREIISHLSKIVGLPSVLHYMRSGLDSDDKSIREITAQTIATATTATGVSSVIPFLKAVLLSKKSFKIRHTGVRIIDAIAFQLGNGVLPFLPSFVELLKIALSDEEMPVIMAALKCITTIADSSSPYGGEVFSPISDLLFSEDMNSKLIEARKSRYFFKALGSLIMTMDVSKASYHFGMLSRQISRWFESPNVEDKLASLIVCSRAMSKRLAPSITQELFESFFQAFFKPFSIPDTRFTPHLILISTQLAKISSIQRVLDRLFTQFNRGVPEYRILVVSILGSILSECQTSPLSDEMIIMISNSLLIAMDDKIDDKAYKSLIKVFSSFIESIGSRVQYLLDEVVKKIDSRIDIAEPKMRQQSTDLISIFSSSFNNKKTVNDYFKLTQEVLDTEHPFLISSALDAIRSLLKCTDLSADELLPNLVPILKNRNDRVSLSCVSLISLIASRPSKVNSKEWIRVAFGVLDLFKSDRKKVRVTAIEAFASISSVIGPFDILNALLNNLQVQERTIRQCTTVAISVLAEKCGTFNILPHLMNEYQAQDMNVQTGSLKAIQYIFQAIGPECSDYAYAVVSLLTNALTERDSVHRQLACLAVREFALGCFGEGKEDIMMHLMNYVVPNVFESTLHFIDAVMDCVDSLRVSLGPGIVLQYCLSGLFHPARKVRSQFWRIYNNLVVYSGGQLVPYFPLMKDTDENKYHRHELDVFV